MHPDFYDQFGREHLLELDRESDRARLAASEPSSRQKSHGSPRRLRHLVLGSVQTLR